MLCVCDCMYVCALCVHCSHGDEKRALDPLELELQMVKNCHVAGGYRTRVPSASAFNRWLGHLSSPLLHIIYKSI